MQGAVAAHRRPAALGVSLLLMLAGCTPAGDEPGAVQTEPPPEPVGEEIEPLGEEIEPLGEESEEQPDEGSEDATATLDTIAEQVSGLRGLAIEEDIVTEVVSHGELTEVVTDRDRDTEGIERLAASARVLAALRHVPPDADLEAIVEDLHSASVVGLYDHEAGVVYVSSDELPLGPGAATRAAHELLHALQDQHFDLTRLDDIPLDDGDAVLAFLSVVEGDAMLLEEEWAATHQTDEERAEAERRQLTGAGQQLEVLEDVPAYVVETFVFPYMAGERFVAALIEEGGYQAVDAALEEPPTTTLEILDPQTYLDGFDPAGIEAGELPAEDFEEVLSSTFGAFELLALFGSANSDDAQAGAATWPAWQAGALAGWERGEELVVAGAWRFDDTERADSACGALPAWYSDVADGQETGAGVLEGDRDVFVVDCDGDEVRFAIGPDADLAQAALGRD